MRVCVHMFEVKRHSTMNTTHLEVSAAIAECSTHLHSVSICHRFKFAGMYIYILNFAGMCFSILN
jgi:hypothetical protein